MKIKRIKEIIKILYKISKENPFVDKFDALKKAYAIVKCREEQDYRDNGPEVYPLTGSHNPSDWTY